MVTALPNVNLEAVTGLLVQPSLVAGWASNVEVEITERVPWQDVWGSGFSEER